MGASLAAMEIRVAVQVVIRKKKLYVYQINKHGRSSSGKGSWLALQSTLDEKGLYVVTLLPVLSQELWPTEGLRRALGNAYEHTLQRRNSI